MTDVLVAALCSIPADDRETWVRIGMAIKSELGEEGFDLWDRWSRQSDAYKVADARAVWKSCKPTGGITIASLYHEAKSNGWQGEAPVVRQVDPGEQRRRVEDRAKADAERRLRQQRQIGYARALIQRCEYGPHPYLLAKGFPEENGLLAAGYLIIPMRHYRTNEVQSVQMIDAEGRKTFLKEAPASEAVFKMGRGVERFYCEGYATALSIREALKHLYRDKVAEVCVCFSAGNLTKVANPQGRGFVIADNDASGTGEKYARKTGLPYWMPPEVGMDANDYHQQYGIAALAEALRETLIAASREAAHV